MSESRSELVTGIRGNAFLRTEDPTCLCYHSIYHFAQDTSSAYACGYLCVPEGFSHRQKVAKLVVRPDTEREISGLSLQTKKVWVCVCVWERESECDNIPQNPLVLLALALCVPSRDRTSHVRFQNRSQFQGRPHFKRYIYNHRRKFLLKQASALIEIQCVRKKFTSRRTYILSPPRRLSDFGTCRGWITV